MLFGCCSLGQRRVAIYSAILASHIGYNKEKVENIYNIALLHDVGKIVVPNEILNKPAKLTEEEYEIIKSHTVTGYDILKEIETLPELAIGAHYHHERLDGKGYPEKLEGAEIPYIAKIIAVADTFDAMNSTRPYRERMSYPDIAKELRRVEGTQLDLEIVEILLKLLENGKLEGEIEETQKYFDSVKQSAAGTANVKQAIAEAVDTNRTSVKRVEDSLESTAEIYADIMEEMNIDDSRKGVLFEAFRNLIDQAKAMVEELPETER